MEKLTPQQLDSLEQHAKEAAPGVCAVEAAELAELVRSYRVCGFILASCRCEFPGGHEGEHSFEPALRAVAGR